MLNHFFLGFSRVFTDNPGRSIKPQNRTQRQYLFHFKVSVYILQHSLRMVAKIMAVVVGIRTSCVGEENAAFLTDSPSICYQPYNSTNICLFPAFSQNIPSKTGKNCIY